MYVYQRNVVMFFTNLTLSSTDTTHERGWITRTDVKSSTGRGHSSEGMPHTTGWRDEDEVYIHTQLDPNPGSGGVSQHTSRTPSSTFRRAIASLPPRYVGASLTFPVRISILTTAAQYKDYVVVVCESGDW